MNILRQIINGLFQLLEWFVSAVGVVFIAVGALIGGGVSWLLLLGMDPSTIFHVAGTMAGAMTGALIAWLVWTLLKWSGGEV